MAKRRFTPKPIITKPGGQGRGTRTSSANKTDPKVEHGRPKQHLAKRSRRTVAAPTTAVVSSGEQASSAVTNSANSPDSAVAAPAVPATTMTMELAQQKMLQRAATEEQRHRSQQQEAVLVDRDADDAGEPKSLAEVVRNTLSTSWFVSVCVHIAIILALALFVFELPERVYTLTATVVDPENVLEEEFDEAIPEIPVEIQNERQITENIPAPDLATIDSETLQADIAAVDSIEAGSNAASQELMDIGIEMAPANDLMSEIGTGTGSGDRLGSGRGRYGAGGGLGGRAQRRKDALAEGATKESEDAVALALQWLAAHQLRDGSWNFDHRRGGPSQLNPGTAFPATRGATGLALLPFLGAGQTHFEGKYKNHVALGLNYLIATQKGNGSFHESAGNMYSHGIVTLALCEALAMQVDGFAVSPGEHVDEDGDAQPPQPDPQQVVFVNPNALRNAAQGAINFIQQAQHVGGGWRYHPNQAGDTSVVGWQVMALKSGQMAQLAVDGRTLLGAHRFLDSVSQNEYGSQYGYNNREGKTSTTAIGLLCRMYAGWGRNHPGIDHGANWLGNTGPNTGDLYYSYYATQVMRHYGGPLWEQWNKGMRDGLVQAQNKNGAERGSWFMGGAWSKQGGRLYETAMACMILEVYYRHMRIYKTQAIEDDQVPAQNMLKDPNAKEDKFQL